MGLSINPLSSVQTALAPTRTAATGGTSGVDVTGGASSDGLIGKFGNMLDTLSATQNNADQLAVKAATGDLASIQALTMATTEAQLMTQLTVTIRNKAVEAFKDIMGMQV